MRRASLALVVGLGLLAGCETVTVPVEGLGQPVDIPEAAMPEDGALPVASQELADYFGKVEQQLVTQGLLRTDGGGPDVPFDADDLARNFARIALFEEYSTRGGRIVARQTESVLHRWEEPILLATHFGETVPPDQRQFDRASAGRYLARLSRITGHPMRLTRGEGNFDLFIVNDAERRALGPELERLLPGISDAAIRAVTEMPRSTLCLVFAHDPADDGIYSRAVAVVRAEHPDLLRLSCIHEEVAQGLGLSNDSPQARPSIFNDDEEFALLTSHDELLLKMLFDPRLEPGMSVAAANPIITQIAADLLPDTQAMN